MTLSRVQIKTSSIILEWDILYHTSLNGGEHSIFDKNHFTTLTFLLFVNIPTTFPWVPLWRTQIIIRIIEQKNFDNSIVFQTTITQNYVACLYYTTQHLHLLSFGKLPKHTAKQRIALSQGK
jgi:hypothetical protein